MHDTRRRENEGGGEGCHVSARRPASTQTDTVPTSRVMCPANPFDDFGNSGASASCSSTYEHGAEFDNADMKFREGRKYLGNIVLLYASSCSELIYRQLMNLVKIECFTGVIFRFSFLKAKLSFNPGYH